jgi:two-component system phosphate regulon sensor histidine kinase PhoR
MSNRTYLLRLIIPFAVMVVIVVGLSGWLIYRSGYETARQQQMQDLAGDASQLSELLRSEGFRITDTVRRRIDDDTRFRDVRFTIIDRDGNVMLDTRAALEALNNHNDRPEVVEARRVGTGASIRDSYTQKMTYVYAAQAVPGSDGVIARASRAERTPLQVSTRMVAQLAGAVVASVLIMSLLALMLHRRWIAPVMRLASAAEQMAAGQWQTRVEPAGVSELREFSTRLNDLAEQAQKQVDDLQHQRSDLTSLVDSLPDPIVLTDPSQRVILINQPAARFLHVTTQQATGAKLISILGETSLLDVHEQITSHETRAGTPIVREIRVTRQAQKLTYQAVAARMQGGGVLMVLRDVSQLASAVQMKTDFVANASHELRTPIAAIKIAFETLSDVYSEDPQQTARCIEIIADHLRRLEEMLQDLLDLSRVETPDLKPEIAPLRGAEVLAAIRNTMGPLARNKEIDLSLEVEEGLTFDSDRRLLNLVLKNLVENAIKYTPPGGRASVKLSREPAEEGGSNILLRVTDTGIGIPPQHLERVFERFYQVDAARSGSGGRGTGLGLAIVKHAVLALGGQVKLDSTLGRGTTVTCTLPERAG